MEEGEKKPDAGTISGSPQKKIVYAVLAVAVVILAVVLIAKFGYNTDLLNPAGGQMSLVQRPPRTVITMIPPVRPITSGIVRLPACTADQTYCNGACVYLMTDSKNCGTCGNDCSKLPNVGNAACSNGKCVISDCSSANHGLNWKYADCDKNPLNGCETDIFINSNSCGRCGLKCPDDRPFCDCGVCLTQEEHDHEGIQVNGIWYPLDCYY